MQVSGKRMWTSLGGHWSALCNTGLSEDPKAGTEQIHCLPKCSHSQPNREMHTLFDEKENYRAEGGLAGACRNRGCRALRELSGVQTRV